MLKKEFTIRRRKFGCFLEIEKIPLCRRAFSRFRFFLSVGTAIWPQEILFNHLTFFINLIRFEHRENVIFEIIPVW